MNRLKPLTLLYVEDDQEVRKNGSEYFEHYFKKVIEATNANDALSYYNELKPDIIITDIRMPEIDGLEFASIIRDRDRRIPIIITTAYTDTDYLLKAVELGLIKYIIKPFTSSTINEALITAYEVLDNRTKSLYFIDRDTIYDSFNGKLIIDKRDVKLTYNQHRLLTILLKHHDRVVTYQEIESHIWRYEGMSMDALRTLVRSLRRKFPKPNIIENLSGFGYRIRMED